VVRNVPDLKSQRKLAARVLNCGKSRIWFDPSRADDISDAITAADVRWLAKESVIAVLPKRGISSFRHKFVRLQKEKGRRKGKGSRKGAIGSRIGRKKAWIKRIRVIRKTLRELKENKNIGNKTFRRMYAISKSGYIRSRSHLMTYMERNDMLKKPIDQKNPKRK
jgi:large subunit ribosomal protein L19e